MSNNISGGACVKAVLTYIYGIMRIMDTGCTEHLPFTEFAELENIER